MQIGRMYLWRFKAKGGIYHFGYIVTRHGNMVQIGPYNGAHHGVWVNELEVECEPYHS